MFVTIDSCWSFLLVYSCSNRSELHSLTKHQNGGDGFSKNYFWFLVFRERQSGIKFLIVWSIMMILVCYPRAIIIVDIHLFILLTVQQVYLTAVYFLVHQQKPKKGLLTLTCFNQIVFIFSYLLHLPIFLSSDHLDCMG